MSIQVNVCSLNFAQSSLLFWCYTSLCCLKLYVLKHEIYCVYVGDEFQEKELEHSSLQEKLDMELKELDKKLQQKEVYLFASFTF